MINPNFNPICSLNLTVTLTPNLRLKKSKEKKQTKVGKVRVEPKTIGIVAVAHNRYMPRDPHSLNDKLKLTLLFELRQDRRIHSHFLTFITSCKMSSIKIWFVLAAGLCENLTQVVFRQPFVIQHDVREHDF